MDLEDEKGYKDQSLINKEIDENVFDFSAAF
jgi:hypothetical protein